ncbi:MAG: hypothetical protein ACREVD_02605 [Burkholderiales bacterium]
MRSRTNERFRKAFESLPGDVQRRAREAYARWQVNPAHPALQYKKVHATQPIYSVRITRDWRAVGVAQGQEMIWFWIGSHADYEGLLTQLRRG